MTKDYHLFGIGNALLDTEYLIPEEFLITNHVPKGRMTLIDSARRNALINAMGGKPFNVGAGGSVANSMYAAQGFGCRNYFAGVVQEDEVGIAFVDELTQAGIDTLPPRVTEEGKSGQCLIFITPDGQRSMNTSIGIADSFHLCDLPLTAVRSAEIVFVEGYLASSPSGRNAARTVVQSARLAGVQTSMTLADVSIIQNFKSSIEYIIGPELDILFCNKEEALAWCNVSTVEASYDTMLAVARLCVITMSENGCIVLQRGQPPVHVPGVPQTPLDSNGAGDMFAGAFLTGKVHNWDSLNCAHFANSAASTIVTQYGARMHTLADYDELWHSFHRESRSKGTS